MTRGRSFLWLLRLRRSRFLLLRLLPLRLGSAVMRRLRFRGRPFLWQLRLRLGGSFVCLLRPKLF